MFEVGWLVRSVGLVWYGMVGTVRSVGMVGWLVGRYGWLIRYGWLVGPSVWLVGRSVWYGWLVGTLSRSGMV